MSICLKIHGVANDGKSLVLLRYSSVFTYPARYTGMHSYCDWSIVGYNWHNCQHLMLLKLIGQCRSWQIYTRPGCFLAGAWSRCLVLCG